jgi:hypothetical protein
MKRSSLHLIGLLFCLAAFSQVSAYKYQRELIGVKDTWHSIFLPEDLFGKLENPWRDIRIYGISEKGDTIEAPYVLDILKDEKSNADIPCRVLNKSRGKDGFNFTVEVPSSTPVQVIDLGFEERNFDWNLRLEGSMDQSTWYAIHEQYRIVSIQNELTDYSFTKVLFPTSNYRFYRFVILTDKKVGLKSATVSGSQIRQGSFVDYATKKWEVREVKSHKLTYLDIELYHAVPVSLLSLSIASNFDYYRPVTIKSLRDSVKTERGWHYNYDLLGSNTASSVDHTPFEFSPRIARKFQVIIQNHDNQPLTIEDVRLTGYSYQLIARFTEPATYFLVYGNSSAQAPRYDISRFQLPETAAALTFGLEMKTTEGILVPKQPLIGNSRWLWGILVVMVLGIGWFSIRMLKQP